MEKLVYACGVENTIFVHSYTPIPTYVGVVLQPVWPAVVCSAVGTSDCCCSRYRPLHLCCVCLLHAAASPAHAVGGCCACERAEVWTAHMVVPVFDCCTVFYCSHTTCFFPPMHRTPETREMLHVACTMLFGWSYLPRLARYVWF